MANVALINHAEADVDALQDVLEAAQLPPGDVLLVVGDRQLDKSFQGMTIARKLIGDAATIYGLEDHLFRAWDCGIVIGPKWAENQSQYPVYFAYILGHELGHAVTVLSNLTVAIYEELIVRHAPRVSGRTGWLWHEFPHELRYDQFGLAIARKVYGNERVKTELREMLNRGLCDDPVRIRKALAFPDRGHLRGLQEELAEFTLPFKHDLIKAWNDERERTKHGTAALLRDPEWLWRPRTSQ